MEEQVAEREDALRSLVEQIEVKRIHRQQLRPLLVDVSEAWVAMDKKGLSAVEFAVLLEANKTFGTSGGGLMARSESIFM